MIAWLFNEMKNPEFWTSIAFLCIVGIFLRPLARYLNRWAQKQAALVQKNREEARSIRKKAENLLKQYESINRHRESDRERLLAEADAEIALLEQESDQRTADRIIHKKQEIDLRLKTIEENGRQDIKNKVLNRIITLTRKKLLLRQNGGTFSEDLDVTVDRVLTALDEYIGKPKA